MGVQGCQNAQLRVIKTQLSGVHTMILLTGPSQLEDSLLRLLTELSL